MITLHLFISGFVQGVGYRQFVKQNAQKLNICGLVTNLPDGRVEAILQSSSQKNLDKLVEICNKGPFLAEVKEVVIQEKTIHDRYDSFEIIS